MNEQHRNFPMVERVVYGAGSIVRLPDILEPRRRVGCMIQIIDDVFEGNQSFLSKLDIQAGDTTVFISALIEPTTAQVDDYVMRIKAADKPIGGVVGVGGGSALDIAKAVSIMLNSPGSSADYQGWDLVQNKAVFHVGVPTISGTGAEVSRTTILCGPVRKLGINSDFTPFNQVILDPDLTEGVPKDQWFYTGMDCFVHCAESLTGTFLNAFSKSYGETALRLCKEVFLDDGSTEQEHREKLMMASWHGGMSIAYSQVGVCHALSYGLSYVLGIRHGIGNCIVFDQLAEFYPEYVALFKQMKEKHNIVLPQGVCNDLPPEQLESMISVSLSLEPLWENALGSQWKQIMTRDKVRELYLRF